MSLFFESLERLDACKEAVAWAKTSGLVDVLGALKYMEEPDWFLWMAKVGNADSPQLKAAVTALRLRLCDFVPDWFSEKSALLAYAGNPTESEHQRIEGVVRTLCGVRFEEMELWGFVKPVLKSPMASAALSKAEAMAILRKYIDPVAVAAEWRAKGLE